MVLASEAGIDPPTFWQLTYRELTNHIKGNRNKEVEKWRRARLVAYWVYRANFKDPLPLDQFLPLEGDEVTKAKPKIATKRDLKLVNKLWQ